ncbi:MAG: hypothetical protein WBI63_10780, partial [Coriobacteriia bacterium]
MVRSFRACLVATCVIVAVALMPAPAFAAEWPAGSIRVALDAQRIAGPDRYATAVATARHGFPAWTGVTHVVIASGETRSAADA